MAVKPPEELQALCALCDVFVQFEPGRGANTWRLTVYRAHPPHERISRIMQSVAYDDWNEIVKELVRMRDE
jgi:hypothetical protein